MTIPGRRGWARSLVGLLLVAGLVLLVWLWARPASAPAYRVQQGPLVQTVVASALVLPAARVQVGSEITGVVAQRFVEAGDFVTENTLMARLVDDEWQARVREAQAALRQLEEAERPQAAEMVAETQSRLAQVEREVQRRRELVAARAESREALERLEQERVSAASALAQARVRLSALVEDGPEQLLAEARLDVAEAGLARTYIHSTVAGQVLEDRVEEGDLVQPGQVLFVVAAEGPHKVESYVDERYLDVLAVGQSAQVVADAFPGQPFPARVDRLAPRVDPDRGAVKLTLALVEPVPTFLRDEMTVTITVETGRAEDALWLPRDAVRHVAGNDGRVALLQGDKVVWRDVQLGLAGDHAVAIAAGLSAGDLVLVNPEFPAGERVRAAVLDTPESSQPAGDRNAVPIRF